MPPVGDATDRAISVLVADDEGLLRGGLRAMLSAEPEIAVVAEAGDGAAAVDATLHHHPDVVLMDVRMPVLDGIEATRRIVAAGSRSRILVVTTFGLDADVFRALRAGASGFLLKATPRTAWPRRSAPSPPASRCSIPRSPAGCSSTSSPGPSSTRPPRSASTGSPPASARCCGCSPAA